MLFPSYALLSSSCADELIERKHIDCLVAKTHLDNAASLRVLEKCGGRKGEMMPMKNPFAKKKVDGKGEGDSDGERKGEGVNGDAVGGGKDGHGDGEVMLQCWYFDRPGTVDVNGSKEG